MLWGAGCWSVLQDSLKGPFEYSLKGKLKTYSPQGNISELKLAFLAWPQTIPSVWLTSGLDKEWSPGGLVSCSSFSRLRWLNSTAVLPKWFNSPLRGWMIYKNKEKKSQGTFLGKTQLPLLFVSAFLSQTTCIHDHTLVMFATPDLWFWSCCSSAITHRFPGLLFIAQILCSSVQLFEKSECPPFHGLLQHVLPFKAFSTW